MVMFDEQRIEPSEQEYLEYVFSRVDSIPGLQQQITAIVNAKDMYLMHLFNKYGFDPATTMLERDGTFKQRTDTE